jgi:hypothetical protein
MAGLPPVDFDHDDPTEQLLALDEWAIGRDRLARPTSDRADHLGPRQVGAALDPVTVALEPGDVLADGFAALALGHLLPARGVVGVGIAEEHESHRSFLGCVAHRGAPSEPYDE